MNPQTPPELSAELLDDFYAECDEQLTAIRHGLVGLEDSVNRAQAEPAGVEKLFRSFHSLKGNSAIIGLRVAEELAHCSEDFLRELSKGNFSLSRKGLDVLMNSAQRLEQIIVAHRENKSLPDTSTLLEDLRGCLRKAAVVETDHLSEPAPPPAPVPRDINEDIESAKAEGMGIWKFTFCPNRQLDARGINVNSIRARLTGAGKIIQAVPQVRPDGSIAFEFLTALAELPQNISAWEADGVHIQPMDNVPSSPVVAASPQADSAPASSTAQGPFVAPSHIVRVDLSRLDDLMRITGEMVIQRARLEDQLNRLNTGERKVGIRGLNEVNIALGRALRELREGIIRVRLVPVSEIFARMPFVVHDLCRESGKKARLTLEGQHTEIDKYLVERLKDPLLHLVRNSMSHGIETVEERAAVGKSAEAMVFLRACTNGDTVLIEVGDDGRGIDAEAVRQRAVRNQASAEAITSETTLLDLICRPGLSTRDEADRTSGRGMGMSVVYNTIRELGGTLSLDTEKGRGTTFCLRLPLTLAIADVLVISVEGQICAVPQSSVQEVLQMDTAQIRRLNATEVIPYRDSILPVIRLRSMFRLPPSAKCTLPMLVLGSELGRVGLIVDRIHGQREVVVSTLRDPLVLVPGIAGATEMGDGRPVLILDAAALSARLTQFNGTIMSQTPTPEAIAV